jgi:preprotein translocase subunit SecF
MSGLATRLYRGDADLNIVGRRKLWFGIAGGLLLVALLSLVLIGFKPGIEFSGGNEFQVPVKAGTLHQVESTVGEIVGNTVPGTEVASSQQVGSNQSGTYAFRTPILGTDAAATVVQQIEQRYGLQPGDVSDSLVSPNWGKQVTQQALFGLGLFLVVVTAYLVIRFEWRMAVAAVSSLAFDLLATAAVYSIVGFEVTPSTVIGFLTILGFALYDVVVVFDKVEENTRGITGSSTQTYSEAANLALNQTLMRSMNTSLVALLPVGGLLFIGAGLLGAGTLKDLGLVLFIGMGTAVYSSLFFATPVLVWLKSYEPKIAHHTQRVLARRGSLAAKAASGDLPIQQAANPALAAAAPKVGARPAKAKAGRPGGPKRR